MQRSRSAAVRARCHCMLACPRQALPSLVCGQLKDRPASDAAWSQCAKQSHCNILDLAPCCKAGLLHLAHSCGMPHCCRFNSINGMLIPGGSADLKPGHPFYDATQYLFKLALEANDKGDYFPVSHAPHS